MFEKEKAKKMLEEQGEYLVQDMAQLREKLEKVPDSDEKALLLRFLDVMIMRAEADVSSPSGDIKLIEHRAEIGK